MTTNDRWVETRISTWNVGPGGDPEGDLDLFGVQEVSDQTDFLRRYAQRERMRMIRGRKLGQPATALLWSPRRWELLKPIQVLLAQDQNIGKGTGPDHMKNKWAQGGFFFDLVTHRHVACVVVHDPPGQDNKPPYNERTQVAWEMNTEVVKLLNDYNGIKIVLSDSNAEADVHSTMPYRQAGYECDQLIKRLPTHQEWCPDSVRWKAPRAKVRFVSHHVNTLNKRDHRQDVAVLEISKRKGVQ